MRFLFTAAPTPAHFHIQIPLAQALRSAGHEVAFATGANVVPRIERAGFQAFAAGPPDAWPRSPGPPSPEELVPWVWEELYAGPPAAERLADLVPLCRTWHPRIIVRENAELAGCIAAEAVGIPHAVVQNGNLAVVHHLRKEPLRERLDALRARYGLSSDPDLAMLFRYLLLLPVPRRFHDPALPLPPTAQFLRPLTFDLTGDEDIPSWIDTLPPQPTVYMTLGTVFNARRDLFGTVIEAVRDEPMNLIVTVGRDQDPTQFGLQSGNVHVERYIPQSLVLSHCAAMVNIAGMNSLRSAFEHGLPLLLLPLVAEHAFNAARCEALGIARVLDHRAVTPQLVRAALWDLLENPVYRANAQRVRAELDELPDPRDIVPLLEQLAVEKRPLLTPDG